jgi:hypothetical protein
MKAILPKAEILTKTLPEKITITNAVESVVRSQKDGTDKINYTFELTPFEFTKFVKGNLLSFNLRANTIPMPGSNKNSNEPLGYTIRNVSESFSTTSDGKIVTQCNTENGHICSISVEFGNSFLITIEMDDINLIPTTQSTLDNNTLNQLEFKHV